MLSTFFLLKKIPNSNYQGINRSLFPANDHFEETFINEVLRLEMDEKLHKSVHFISALKNLNTLLPNTYELLSNQVQEGLNWEFLGYDVAENINAYWSAINHMDVFIPEAEIPVYQAKLNQYGLFEGKEAAKCFLSFYLESDDPDMGWTADGWDDTPDFYRVMGLYRYTFQE